MKTLKLIFAGTPDFAVPSLQALIDSSHEVIAVYTQPDRPAGRGRKLTPSPIKQLALEHNIPVFQPKTLRSTDEHKKLQELNADAMIVTAYGLILPPEVLAIPKMGCINVHGSLLPRWRGAAPVQRAIEAGDKTTGITVMQMDKGLDTGEMLSKVECPISDTDTSETLLTQLAKLGGPLLIKTLDELEAGNASAHVQDESQATYADKITKEEARINWDDDALKLSRTIRAFNPWPISQSTLAGEIVRVWQAFNLNTSASEAPGTIVASSKDGIDVATGNGVLRITQLQLPGGKPLTAEQILNSKASSFAVGNRFE